MSEKAMKCAAVAYDYRAAVKKDVEAAFKRFGITTRLDGEACEDLCEELFIGDAVTGSRSGSYTFSRWKAEENLCHNWRLLKEALDELGGELDLDDPEGADVAIRCHLLAGAVREVSEALPEEAEGKTR